MIEISEQNATYICPFCSCSQSYTGSSSHNNVGLQCNHVNSFYIDEDKEANFTIYFLRCTNLKCRKTSVVAFNKGRQFDLIPEFTYKHYPDYIPEQIKTDYVEGIAVLERSPKAAATMFRRCLQGMIRNFWGISGKTLNTEISQLKDKVQPSQWNAIDAVRKIGNISAHMEQDVNIIIDVDKSEAEKLQSLIELLLEKWYIARHDEEELCNSLSKIADEKTDKK